MKNHLAYNEYGDSKNPTIVLLHGFLGSQKIWNRFVQELKNKFHILTIDLPGHGESDLANETIEMSWCANLVIEILHLSKVTKAHFVGHSMGGYVALALLDSFPNYTLSITLLNSTAASDTEQKKKERLLAVRVFDMNPEVFIREAITNLFYPQNLTAFAKEIAVAQKIALQTSLQGAKGSLKGMRIRNDYTDLIRKTNIPFHYIAGVHDAIIPFDTILQQVNNKKEAVTILQKTAHMGFIEEYKRSLEGIVTFLKNIEKD